MEVCPTIQRKHGKGHREDPIVHALIAAVHWSQNSVFVLTAENRFYDQLKDIGSVTCFVRQKAKQRKVFINGGEHNFGPA